MTIKEQGGNIFDMPHGVCFAHSISADFVLASGVAKQFDEMYNMSERLSKMFGYKFSAVGLALKVDNVYNLVTKSRGRDTPCRGNLREALVDMKEQILFSGVKRLVMPKICCGRDGMSWNSVNFDIQEVFSDTDIDIIICDISIPVETEPSDEVAESCSCGCVDDEETTMARDFGMRTRFYEGADVGGGTATRHIMTSPGDTVSPGTNAIRDMIDSACKLSNLNFMDNGF